MSEKILRSLGATDADMEAPLELYAEIIDKILLYKDHALDIHFKHIYEPVRLEYMTRSRGEHYRVECKVRQAA